MDIFHQCIYHKTGLMSMKPPVKRDIWALARLLRPRAAATKSHSQNCLPRVGVYYSVYNILNTIQYHFVAILTHEHDNAGRWCRPLVTPICHHKSDAIFELFGSNYPVRIIFSCIRGREWDSQCTGSTCLTVWRTSPRRGWPGIWNNGDAFSWGPCASWFALPYPRLDI